MWIKPLADKLRGHDTVLVIGAPVFRYYPYVASEYLPEGTDLLQITNDPALAGAAPVGRPPAAGGQQCAPTSTLVFTEESPRPTPNRE